MSTDRRNPYVILGIPFGSDRATAERAFSQRSRLARKGGDFPHSVDDLIWAINQVESHLDDPTTSAATYRIPVYPEALRRPTGHGLFRPPLVPLARRTPASTPDEVGAVLAEARKDALDHLLTKAATDVRRRYGLGGDGQPTRPTPLTRYPKRARSKTPILVVLLCLAVVAGLVMGGLYLSKKAKEVDASPPTTTSPPTTIVVTTTAAPTTTVPPEPGLGDRLVRDGIAVTPVQPIDVFGHLCLLFIISGTGRLNFVPAEAILITDQIILPALDVTSGRASSEPVYGETQPTSREICWPVVDWRTQTTELVYTLGENEYRWLISDNSGA
jgi:hypothetical protein